MRTIGEAAKRSGVTVETIRYYEREGIVPAADRHANGRRLYDEGSISRLRFVRRCRDLGFKISDIRALIDLSDASDRSCADVKVIGERHLAQVRERMADLESLEAALIELLQACAEEQSDCPVLKQLFAD
jgi:MerR family mercuric resistance operon transcriptional regulator